MLEETICILSEVPSTTSEIYAGFPSDWTVSIDACANGWGHVTDCTA